MDINEREIFQFHKIAENFMVYLITNEEGIMEIKLIYQEKNKLHLVLRNLLQLTEKDIKTETKLELFSHLIKFSIEKNFDNVEICALLSIFWEIFNLNFFSP